MPMTAPFRERTLDGTQGRVLYTGVHADDAAALTHCAANGVNLTRADLSGRTLDGANVSGLIAPKCDLRGASCRNWVADRLVSGRACELSASLLQGAVITGTLTYANLACTQPTALRAELGPNTRIRGCDWSLCPDVLEPPIPRAVRDRVGRVVVARNGTGWRVHAGDDGCMTEAQAKVTLASRTEYAQALEWLDSAEAATAKAAIEARPVGSGAVVKPSAGDAEVKAR
jgi:hypothetical protein